MEEVSKWPDLCGHSERMMRYDPGQRVGRGRDHVVTGGRLDVGVRNKDESGLSPEGWLG